MYIDDTSHLGSEELLHYMELGLIQGIDREWSSDFVEDIDSRMDDLFVEGEEKGKKDVLDEVYNDLEEDEVWGS